MKKELPITTEQTTITNIHTSFLPNNVGGVSSHNGHRVIVFIILCNEPETRVLLKFKNNRNALCIFCFTRITQILE